MKFYLLLISVTLFSLQLFASDIKTTDLKGQDASSNLNTTTSESISPQQMEELKKSAETIKENQTKAEEMLKELDKE